VGSFFYFYYFWSLITTNLFYLGLFISTTQNLSYLYTGIANPGLSKNYACDYYATYRRYCTKCKIYYDRNTSFHCNYCDICIYNHDHHCPWTGKCIGGSNLKAFYIFVVFTFLLMFYFFFAVIFSLPTHNRRK
jgi:hypothetical protein